MPSCGRHANAVGAFVFVVEEAKRRSFDAQQALGEEAVYVHGRWVPHQIMFLFSVDTFKCVVARAIAE